MTGSGSTKAAGLVAVACGALLLGAVPASGQPFPVNSTNDPGVGVCDMAECTLREALLGANGNGGSPDLDTITITATGDIVLQSALPDIETKTTITGPGPDSLRVTKAVGGNYRIFTMSGLGIGDSVTIENLTVAGGNPGVQGGGIFSDTGGINTLRNVVVRDNLAPSGGGIANIGTLDVFESTIRGNQATDPNGQGGGIVNRGQLTVQSSTLTGNSVNLGADGGGGIWTGETGTNSTFITNSTVAGNTVAGTGGGLRLSNGDLLIESSTIVGNTSDSDDSNPGEAGAGFFTVPTAAGDGTQVANTILAGNKSGTASPVANQCTKGSAPAVVDSDGHNLRSSTDASCDASFATAGDFVDPNPLLGALGFYGGPTPTIPLLAGSPARNAGDPGVPGGLYPACDATDQRGFARGGAEGVCDIGAFEGIFVPPGGSSPTPPPGAATRCKKGFRLKRVKRKGKKRKRCVRKKKKRRR